MFSYSFCLIVSLYFSGANLVCSAVYDYDINWKLIMFNSTDNQTCPRKAQGNDFIIRRFFIVLRHDLHFYWSNFNRVVRDCIVFALLCSVIGPGYFSTDKIQNLDQS